MSLEISTSKKGRVRRAIQAKEPKAVENTKKLMLIKGHKTSQICSNLFHDLDKLKTPDIRRYYNRKKNTFSGPFVDPSSIEFFSQKTDSSLFVYASHQKKRPHNVVFGRLFDFHVLDMMEFGLSNYQPISSFKPNKSPFLGSKPCFVWLGEEWTEKEEYRMAGNLMLDIFRGSLVKNINLAGIDRLISLSVSPSGSIQFRSYAVSLKKSGTKIPKPYLEELGPHFDLDIRRTHFASSDLKRKALKIPKELNYNQDVNGKRKLRGSKNIFTDEVFRNRYATVHVHPQSVEEIGKGVVKAKALRDKTIRKRRRMNDSTTQEVGDA